MSEPDKPFPWLPLYVDDFQALASILTPEQLGGFMRLRVHAWKSQPPCTVPSSPARLSVISGLNGAWEGNAEAILELFSPDGSGRLLDHNLLLRYNQQKAKHRTASANGKLGGRPKANGNQPTKLDVTSAFPQLHSLSGIPSNSSRPETLEGAKLNETLAFAQLSPEQQAEWLTANPGRRIPA
jgi:uncharacterized protein YdaU (DUF1376 family)